MPPRREMVEGLPTEPHLARSKLERLDLLREVGGLRGHEEDRQRVALRPPPHMMERPSPLGIAPLPPRRRAATASTAPPSRGGAAVAAAVAAAEAAAGAGQEQPARRSRVKKIDISQDPTTLPNEHIERHAALGEALVEQRRWLEAARSESALRRLQGGADLSAPPIKYDRLPTANSLGTTEQRMNFYARSLEKNQACGNVIDPRSKRPYDDWYIFRESIWKQSALLKG